MAQMVDVRSDTVTQPSAAMLQAMLQAEVGDDVYGEDKTVNELQRRAAELFGKEAALFCPSGTMSNQIGIKVHTQPGDEVICDELAHVYLYEGGGIAANSGASVRLLRGDRGRFTAAQVRDSINRRDDAHLPWTRVVAIENSVNRGGGCCWDLAEIARIRAVCDEHGLGLHLDGARLFNALVARNESPRDHRAPVRHHLYLPLQGSGRAGGLTAARLARTSSRARTDSASSWAAACGSRDTWQRPVCSRSSTMSCASAKITPGPGNSKPSYAR